MVLQLYHQPFSEYSGLISFRIDWFDPLMLGKIEGRRRSEWQRKRQLDSITDSTDMSLSKLQEIAENRGAWRAAVHGVTELDTTE